MPVRAVSGLDQTTNGGGLTTQTTQDHVRKTIAMAGLHVATAQHRRGDGDDQGATASALIAIAMIMGTHSSRPDIFATWANLETEPPEVQ